MSQPVAIITGGGRGIGRATAIELARRGFRLAVASRNLDELNEALGLAGAASAEAGIAIRADVSQAAEVDQLVAAAVEAFGRIDAIVHAAGVAPVRAIAQMQPEEWHAVIDTNLSAAFYLLRAAWPVFERQGTGGAVVNVSSFAARDPFPGFAAYGAAKAGLNLLGLSAAREGEPIGVRVHTVAPAAVETGMFRQILSPDQYPPDKTLDPADVARVIGQCIVGDMKYTSGEVIYVRKSL